MERDGTNKLGMGTKIVGTVEAGNKSLSLCSPLL